MKDGRGLLHSVSTHWHYGKVFPTEREYHFKKLQKYFTDIFRNITFAQQKFIYSLKQNTMNTNKLLLGTLLGGVGYFLFGFILYGMVFRNTLASMMPNMASVQKEQPDMIAMVISNLAAAFLLAYIFEKWAGIRTFMGGLVAGATIGFLIGFSYDAAFHATSTLWTWDGLILDAVICAVVNGLAGGIIGWWLGYNRK
jgi:hypothetical protein